MLESDRSKNTEQKTKAKEHTTVFVVGVDSPFSNLRLVAVLAAESPTQPRTRPSPNYLWCMCQCPNLYRPIPLRRLDRRACKTCYNQPASKQRLPTQQQAQQ